MSEILYRDERPSLTTAQLASVREYFGDVYDRLLSRIYKRGNGGVPLYEIVTSPEKIEYWLQYVFPVPDEIGSERNDIFKNNDHYHAEKMVPEEYIVFGEDPGANLFSVNRITGSIYYHATDLWDEDASLSDNYNESISLVSHDLNSFITSLRKREC